MLLFEYLCMYVWLLLVKLNYILKLIIIRIKLEILATKFWPNALKKHTLTLTEKKGDTPS